LLAAVEPQLARGVVRRVMLFAPLKNDKTHDVRAGIDCDRRHMMHVLRDTAASAWLQEGISIRAAAEFPGDTDATVQATYSDLMPDDRDQRALGAEA